MTDSGFHSRAALIPTAQDDAMATHTPGPWSYCGASRGGCSCATVSGADHPVATVTIGEWGDEYPSIRLSGPSMDRTAEAYMEKSVYGEVSEAVAKANAYLISAAPEMLEALRMALPYVEDASDSAPLADQEFIRAAILKATGNPTPHSVGIANGDEPKTLRAKDSSQ